MLMYLLFLMPSASFDRTNGDHQACLNFVTRQIDELRSRCEQCQSELRTKIMSVDVFSSAVQHVMETYIDEHFSSLRTEIEHEIEVVRYDYQIRALKLAYNQHNPTPYQVGFSMERGSFV